MNKKEIEKMLMKYSKEEIVQGILGNCFGDDFPHILHSCWRARHERLYQEMVRASREDTTALSPLMEFENEMATKYGNGKKLPLAKLSKQEFEKWARLKEDWQKKFKANERANKNMDKFYKEYMYEEKSTD